MGRKTFKNVAEPQERREACTTDVHSAGYEPTEMELDAMALQDCQSRCDGPESIQSCLVDAAVTEPTEEQIRRRAYEICQARNGAWGDPVADWLQAELELRARHLLQIT